MELLEVNSRKNLFCLVVEKENEMVEVIWSIKESASFKSNPNQKITDIRGRILETKDSPIINISGEEIYLKKQKRNYKEINLKEITVNTLNS